MAQPFLHSRPVPVFGHPVPDAVGGPPPTE